MSLFSRAASLAVVPVKSGARFAGAATISAFGGDRDAAYGKALQASAEELTAALAKARGPVMKFGQLLALFSSTLPPEQAEILSSLTRLYEDAEPRPFTEVQEAFDRLPAGVNVDEVAVAARWSTSRHQGSVSRCASHCSI